MGPLDAVELLPRPLPGGQHVRRYRPASADLDGRRRERSEATTTGQVGGTEEEHDQAAEDGTYYRVGDDRGDDDQGEEGEPDHVSGRHASEQRAPR